MNKVSILRAWRQFLQKHRVGIASANLYPEVKAAFDRGDEAALAQLVDEYPEVQDHLDYLRSGCPALTWEEIKNLPDEELVARQDRTGVDIRLSNSPAAEVPMMDAILDLFKHPAETVLDVGCGTGYRLTFLATIGLVKTAIGIDLSDLSLAKARQIAEAEGVESQFIMSSCTNIPLPSESVDRVMMIDVLLWVKEWDKALQEVARVLRQGARVLLVYNRVSRRMVIDVADAIQILEDSGVSVKSIDERGLNAFFLIGVKR